MSLTPHDTLHDWLSRQGLTADYRETHASVVAITTDRVYKIKKAVRFPFLDLSTPEQRLRVCRREVELNRRLSPDVYLGVVPVTDAHGVTIDHAVEMVRLPDDRRLDALLHSGDPGPCLRELAGVVARFQEEADRSPEIERYGSLDAVRRLWDAGIEQTRPFEGRFVDADIAAEVALLALRYVDGRAALFDARVARGRIRDGHGDLRADDVFCLPDGLRVIDCLEFDDRLRWGDTLADVAFLAMDLEWLGRADLARRFLDDYRHAARDSWPGSLEHHWIAYRAHVRAKVACLRADAGVSDAVRHAAGHLELARAHLREAQVRLILVGGLPGTGKTTVARGLAVDGDTEVLRTDVIRRELFGERSATEPTGFEAGRYGAEATEDVYAEMLRRAARLLGLGVHVVLDASWAASRHRHAARLVARAGAADVEELQCVAAGSVAAERLRRRARAGVDESDADEVVAAAMAQRFDAWPESTLVDSDAPVQVVVERAQAALRHTIR